MKKWFILFIASLSLVTLTSCSGKNVSLKLDGNEVLISEFGSWQFMAAQVDVSKDNEMVEEHERKPNGEGGYYGSDYQTLLYNQKYGLYANVTLSQYDDVTEYHKNKVYSPLNRYRSFTSIDRDYYLKYGNEYKFGNNSLIHSSNFGDYPVYFKDLSNNCYFSVYFWGSTTEVRNESANEEIANFLSKIKIKN